MPTTPVFPIGVVRDLTGLSERQIRYYEEIGLISPARTRGNQRRFSQEDLERLLEIKRLFEQGLTPRDIRERLSRRQKKQDTLYQNDSHIWFRRNRGGLSSVHPVLNQDQLVRLLKQRRSRS